MIISRPYGKDFLSALKQARVKQVRSQAVANELFTYVIFLIVLFIISYANRDADSFKIKNHLGKLFFGSGIPHSAVFWDTQLNIIRTDNN
mgnify:FL=1